MIELIYDKRDLAQLLSKLESLPRGLAKVTSRAINRTLTATRAEMVRLIRTEYAIKAGAVRKELRITNSTAAKLEGRIEGEQSPGVPLIEFVKFKRVPSTLRTKSGGYAPKIGVPVLVRRSKGKRIIPGAFTAQMASGHKGIFVRGARWKAGKKGTKSNLGKREIMELYGPTPIMLLGTDERIDQIEEYAQEVMDKNLAREANYILSKEGLL